MTIRNLTHLFNPRSIALIGASTRPGSVGALVAENLLRAGFDGPIMPVHPRHDHIQSVATYPDIASLPITPDLGVIVTPPDSVPGLVGDLARRGAKAAVVITAGVGNADNLRQRMLDAARPTLMRIAGPNCLGIMVPGVNLNASFCGTTPLDGNLAFVAQSGAVITSVVDWATARGIGFSHLVSLGDMADVDFGDMLDYLANDPKTDAILLYIEAVTHARKFMSAARAAARTKPVIVVKAGRFSEGARAAASHTGAMAGSDKVYDTAIRRAGMLRVYSLEELFDAVETLSTGILPRDDRIAIVTNGGGIGVLATDAVIEQGGRLADLDPKTIERLNTVLPPTWSHGNPVDIIGDADGKRYSDALTAIGDDPNVDALLVLNCPTAVASQTEAARAVTDTVTQGQGATILTSWVGNGQAEAARRIFSEHSIPSYATPGQAVRAFMHLRDYKRNQRSLTDTVPSVPEEFTPDRKAARTEIETALGQGRAWLTEPEAKRVLAAYDIPTPVTRIARDPDDAARIATEMDGPVVVKILSPDITHKSDIGGVALDLDGPDMVRQAATAMFERARTERPEARIEGLAVQPMVTRPGAHELIVGVTDDVQFGPLVLFGQGGTAVEVLDDTALALPPINMLLAREAMARTRIFKLLEGYRDTPAADLDAIALTMIKISQLVVDFAEVKELDINPLLADAHGVIALDARIRVAQASGPPEGRMAIRPYPKALEEEVTLEDGRRLLLRPIRPEDEPRLLDSFADVSPEGAAQRFLVTMEILPHVHAARFTQLDYDREMALVLTAPGIPGTQDVFGVVRIAADPDNERAEFAIILRHDMTGLGLGTRMMQRIIAYARTRGIKQLFGNVLHDNTAMLTLCDTLGFERHPLADTPDHVRVTLGL